ncbi:hypothetical protein B0H13DRAFT_2411034, partial [Mycena leptocephala]
MEQDHHSSLYPPSTSHMFQNAMKIGIRRSHFMNVQGNMNIHPMVPLVAPGKATGMIVPNTSSPPQPTVFSESGNYSSQLLNQGRGFPLYVPGPQINLPVQYRREGVAIGDVGGVTPEGNFDFFFNIYLPADHPINANVPEGFVPLSVSSTYLHRIKGAQSIIYSSVPGGEFVFNCEGPKGAVLALPHGAHLEKLGNLASMRQYAAKHAESWYKYVNETRGRGLVNGSLYLITGCEKAKSWGMASF